MTIDPDQVIGFINNNHLFHHLHLSQEQLAEVAKQFEETSLAENELLFHEGDRADSFYLILEGRARLVQTIRGKTKTITERIAGDYFGEEALAGKSFRQETVIAVEDCTLLRLSRSQFRTIQQINPDIKANLHATAENQSLAHKRHWPWLNPDEIVYVLTHRHIYFLFLNLVLPIVALASGLWIFIFLFFYVPPLKGTFLVEAIGSLWCAGALLWAGWAIWDWSNDYCFVTSQRVIWLEKIAGIYESRQEAPANTILTVGVYSDQIGRIVGFGNVIIRTYTGSIVLGRVKHPQVIAAIIEEQLRRSRTVQKKEETSAMEQAIRAKLGLPVSDGDEAGGKTEAISEPIKPIVQPGLLKQLLFSLFQVRIDSGGIVTYRKHWFVLLGATWKQSILFLLVIAALVGRILDVSALLSGDAVVVIGGLSLSFIFLWWLYDVIDWHNDIYQVTPDQIIDIERKPFGSEKKRSAPLENILSIEYERLGILGLLFNYGTVKIKVGNSTFCFDYVFNPSSVQQDIFYRKLAKESIQKKVEREAERDRLSSWIATYHRYTGQAPVTGQNLESDFSPEQKPVTPNPPDDTENHNKDDRDGFGWIE